MNSPRRSKKLSQFESNLLRQKVFKIIKDKSFEKGTFTLASGKQSDYYLDMKPTMFDPEGATALPQLVLDKLEEMRIDYVGGLALGAVPLISAVNIESFKQNRPLPGFLVRKEVKDHGTKKLVEGLTDKDSLAGKNVVILDDVTTTGASAMIAVEAAQTAGAKIIMVLAIVDREEGAVDFYKEKSIPFEALFVASEFMKS